MKVVFSAGVSTLSASGGLGLSHVGRISAARDHRTTRSRSSLVEVDLAVAESAVLETQLVQLGQEGLVLANLTSVEVLQEDTLARSNAGREVRATVATVDVVVINLSVAAALRAVELLVRDVDWRLPREKLDGKSFISFSFNLREFGKSLQFDEGFGALSVALVEEAREGHDTVDLLRAELFLILNQAHSSLHSTGVLLLVHLPLAEQEEMNGFSSLPRISKSLVSAHTDVGGDQRIHGLGCNVSCCIPRLSDLGNLSIKHSLLIRVHFKGRQHIDLLDQQQWSVLLSHFQSDFSEEPCCVCILIGLPVKLNGFNLLVLLDQVGCIALEQLLNLNEVILLSQLYCLIPLIKEHTAVDGSFDIAELHKGSNSGCAEAHGLEAFA